MSIRAGAMSPVSVDGSEWSGIGQYNKIDPPFSPTLSGRANLSTPPVSGGLPGPPSLNGGPRGNPSPPSSVAARSSDGTLGDQQSKRYRRMEESLAQHYNTLRRFLQAPYRDDRSLKPNKARDKLLRLSPTQFHELSTDVYDELVRRQQAMPPPGRPPRPDVPPYLLPRQEFHEKRNQARQKLASLQQQRFKDLATDVFCELERRFPQFAGADMPRMGSPAPSVMGMGRGYPPSRPGSNGYPRGPGPGRGYPSGGPPPGRFPPRQGSLGPASINGDSPDGPLAKSFQSNTIVPNKSTMVESDDEGGLEDDYDSRSDAFGLDGVLQSSRPGTGTTFAEKDKKLLADSQSQVSSLQEKVDELETLVKEKDEEISKLRDDQDRSQINDTEKQEWQDVRADLENKVSQAESLNTSLQSELDRLRMDHESRERDFQLQLDEASRGGSGDSELRAQFEDLQRKHQALEADMREQQQVTEEVRQEASNFLKEMKAMSERSNMNWEREEQLYRDVHRLEEEVKEWKNRYAKAKTQLRQLRASSVVISGMHPDAGGLTKQHELIQEDGLVKDIHVTRFQISIDELLRIARAGEPTLVLDQMKSVVVAVRHITQDIENGPGNEPSQLRGRVKTKVSATANNLITASKNYAHANGLSPVSLLDAAASHLCAAVVELVRAAKIRPTPADELEEEDDDNIAPMQSPGYFSVAPSQNRLSNNDSVYSALSSPSVRSLRNAASRRPGSRNGIMNGQGFPAKLSYGMRPQDADLEELKLYLEDQTEGLVQSIQALVASIRGEDSIGTIRSHITAISNVVNNVVTSTDDATRKPGASPVLQERAGPIVQTLAECRNRLSRTGAEGEEVTNADQLREITSKLPPIAFEIARETKELVQRVDQIELDGGDEDDFR
ncbi:cell polarity protein, putative [Paecilomyces variotii No. 5]|uniref:Cell polarity protein, putative n=1 Tax=Byssochlamys spectabilis (strain No. 5 / NBRC 109023) TaxID=1356009 RepID=V5HSP4_BYSSN|nr:cell polarity protein, putative [Paecilomyces variotii No. 5]